MEGRIVGNRKLGSRQQSGSIHRTGVRLFFLIASALSAFAQSSDPNATDILITSHTPYVDLGRGLKWGLNGPGGVNNNFLVSTFSPDTGVCLWVQNNFKASGHTFSIGLLQTGDPTTTSFINNQGKWLQISGWNAPISQGQVIAGASSAFTGGIANFGLSAYFIQAKGAVRLAINFFNTVSLGTVNDTADIYITQSQGNQCSQNAQAPSPNMALANPDSTNSSLVQPNFLVGFPSASALSVGIQNQGTVGVPILTEKGARWTVNNVSAAGGAIPVAVKAGAAGVRHVLDCFSFGAFSLAATVATINYFQVLDGATVIYVVAAVYPPAAAFGVQLVPDFGQCDLGIMGTAGNSMTAQMTAMPANGAGSVFMTGFDVQ